MIKKLVPLVVVVFLSACSHLQAESGPGSICMKSPCCEQCKCCRSEECGDCCKDGQCSCCKAGSCTMCRGVKEGKTFVPQTEECPECAKAEREARTK